MTDQRTIEERLESAIDIVSAELTKDGTESLKVADRLLRDALVEILHLRSLAGAVSTGLTHAQIKARTRRPIVLQEWAVILQDELKPWDVQIDWMSDRLIITTDAKGNGFFIARREIDDSPSVDALVAQAKERTPYELPKRMVVDEQS